MLNIRLNNKQKTWNSVCGMPPVQKRMNFLLWWQTTAKNCEQHAIALKAVANKELEIVQAMQAQEEAQHAAEEAQKAATDTEEFWKKAEDKNRALNSLMLEDYMRGGPSGHLGTSPPKCEFSKLCQLISTPEGCLSNDMEGVRFLHDVKPNMCEKILY